MTSFDGMMSVEEAQERILAHVQPLGAERVPLLQAQGQVLAQDVYAPFNVPPQANSAMDGYVMRWEDIRRASAEHPVVLPLEGESAAGHPAPQPLRPGAAMRIMTGAIIPEGADTVVPFEDTDELDQRARGIASKGLTQIGIRTASERGSCVRPAGEDAAQGALIFSTGVVLQAAHLGVLASLGFSHVEVVRRPVVAILATGDELREPGEPLGPGQIYNSNSYTTATLVMACGAVPQVLPVARDTVADLTEKIHLGLSTDFFITSAGVSTGEYDLVKDILTQQGTMDFWRVRMRPGKPLAFGLLRRSDGSQLPHLGLPGNPVSSMIAFDQFARPAILKMMGKPPRAHPTVTAVLDDVVVNTDRRRFYARAVLSRNDSGYHVRLTGPQGSNVLTSMALANGLIVVPEERERVERGEAVQVQVLDGFEDILT